MLNHHQILWTGFWETLAACKRTSMPAAKISMRISGSQPNLDLEVEGDAFWEIFVNEKRVGKVHTTNRARYKIPLDNQTELPLPEVSSERTVEIVRRSELLPGSVKVYGIFLEGGKILPLTPSNRRIEFIGDSYTVGYGVEAKNTEVGNVAETTNSTKSYAYLVAKKLKADYRISAFSGRGLVRNYGNIAPGETIPKLMSYTVPGEITGWPPSGKRHFLEWIPQVVCVFIGINDFQGEEPRASEEDFVQAYHELLKGLRSHYGNVSFLLLATTVWPQDILIPAVQRVYQEELSNGHQDVSFKVVYTKNTALHGHPNETSQADLAEELFPKICRLGEFE